jgi:hypothetical protein
MRRLQGKEPNLPIDTRLRNKSLVSDMDLSEDGGGPHTCSGLRGPASGYLKAGVVAHTRRHVRASAWWSVAGCDQNASFVWTFSTSSGKDPGKLFAPSFFEHKSVTCALRAPLNASASLAKRQLPSLSRTTITATFHFVTVLYTIHQQSCLTTKMRWMLMRLLLSPRSNSRQTRMRRAREALPTCQSSCKTHYHGMSRSAIIQRQI